MLGPPPSLVDHHIGQLDGVEVVHDDGGMAKRCDQRTGIPAPRVECDRTHSGKASAKCGLVWLAMVG
jgi:hypothetical protein